ncbi:hypothetical protein LTR78_002207 [Recurvomyces mirabilis]|uniref:Tetratricopeptide repeat protein 1 n=1 Tax=Recurvomyces mirabilis TaxID=574656 RepID=A0AAE0WUK4_9PEZI|nr:hypothetical protein LTR78_002207 [Recurvomyces mirabilis]KAK5160663.1 hypothetical protein LTS14_001675 [Recurvomyces mirabilis]
MPDIDHFSDSENESFHSFDDGEPVPPSQLKHESPSTIQPQHNERKKRPAQPSEPDPLKPRPIVERFPAEEEATLLAESSSLKGSANQLFGKGSFENAIQTYDKALSSCPNYLDYEVAVLRSNIAACHLKLEEWKEAIESAEKGVDCLERLEPLPKPPKPKQKGQDEPAQTTEDDQIVEVDDNLADRIENLQKSGQTIDTVRKLQTKLLLRRAKAKSQIDTWSSLSGADEDYRTLLSPQMQPFLSASDKRQVLESARALAPRLNTTKDKEMAEMMGKLKGLGNSLLKPFGLSTENFQFVKDEKSGGYSMNFNQGGQAKE